MDGKKPHQHSKEDPFVVGQYIGMTVMLTYIENNNGIQKDLLEQIKRACVDKAAESLEKPSEDVYLLVDNLVKDIKVE